MELKYYGHSCFTLKSGNFTIAMDPFTGVVGRADVNLRANTVYCSHQHFDHNYIEGVKLIDGENNPFKVTEIYTFHDEVRGAKRGENIIRIFEAEGLRVAHFGDLGCELEEEQLKLLSNLDVALIPVGDTYTIGPEAAKKLIETIKPVTSIPMHYRKGSEGFSNIRELSDFTDQFEIISTQSGSLDLKNKPSGIVVLDVCNR